MYCRYCYDRVYKDVKHKCKKRNNEIFDSSKDDHFMLMGDTSYNSNYDFSSNNNDFSGGGGSFGGGGSSGDWGSSSDSSSYDSSSSDSGSSFGD